MWGRGMTTPLRLTRRSARAVHSLTAPKGAAAVNSTPTSVAETPLVVATTRSFANKIHNQGIRPTWDMLLKATDALAAGAVSKNDMLPADQFRQLRVLLRYGRSEDTEAAPASHA